MTHISNPITPRTSELSQSIAIEENRIARMKEIRSNADAQLSKVMNESIDWALGRLAKFQKELERIEKYQESLKCQ